MSLECEAGQGGRQGAEQQLWELQNEFNSVSPSEKEKMYFGVIDEYMKLETEKLL